MSLEFSNIKNIAIISGDNILSNNLIENIKFPINLLNYKLEENINDLDKIDLLIIDSIIDNKKILKYKINNVINFTNNKFSDTEILLCKPFKLNSLIKIIYDIKENKYLFSFINKQWIYNQQIAKLTSNHRDISFSDKENMIFATLLNSNNFLINKDLLQSRIWNYNKDTESNTVDTHLYKLKNKLPQGLFIIDSIECSLAINSYFR